MIVRGGPAVSGRPRLLDLFCGAGGCSVGYHRAGFHVTGVDHWPQPNYPYEFHQADALDVLADRAFIATFDAIHASPPCKGENPLRHLHDVEHPDLLTPTLELLAGIDQPWAVENVESTQKMPGSLILCGASFGLQAQCRDGVTRVLRRHRRLASNVFLMAPPCSCSKRIIGVYGHGGVGHGGRPKPGSYRGYQATASEARQALGIGWMTAVELAQAIPPAYTEWIGSQLLDHLKATR